MPSSPAQSVAEIRTDIGLSDGQAARIAANTSSGKRRRFSSDAAIFVGALVLQRRQESGQQIAVRGVELDHVEAGFDAHAHRGDELVANARPCRRGSSACGTWLTGDQGTSLAAITGQLPSSSGTSFLPSRAWSNLWRPNGRAGGRSSPSSWRGRNRRCASTRRHARRSTGRCSRG